MFVLNIRKECVVFSFNVKTTLISPLKPNNAAKYLLMKCSYLVIDWLIDLAKNFGLNDTFFIPIIELGIKDQFESVYFIVIKSSFSNIPFSSNVWIVKIINAL